MTDPGKSSETQNESNLSSFQDELDSASILPAFSVNQITTYRASFLEDLSARRRAGIGAIGLWRQKISQLEESDAVEAVRRSGLEVTSLSFAGGFSGSSGLQFREAIDDSYSALFAAAAFGAGTLVISPGARGRYTARHERRLVVQAIRELSVAGEELGVDLAVLFRRERFAGSWTSLFSLDDAMGLIDVTGRSNVGAVCDAFHFGASDLKMLEEAASRIRVLQLNDAPLASRSEYSQLPPGCGVLPLPEILTCLFENGFTGDIDVQVWSEDLWQQDTVETLSTCRMVTESLLREALCGVPSTESMTPIQS